MLAASLRCFSWSGHNNEMATMDEKSLGTGGGGEGALPLDGPHGDRRRRAHEILSEQNASLDRLESELAEQLQQLVDEVAESVRRAETAAAGSVDESDALAALRAQFDVLKGQFGDADAEAAQLRRQIEQDQLERARVEQELRVRDALLKETQSRDEQRHVELAAVREKLADAEAQLNAARMRHTALEQELSAQRDQIKLKQEETKAQRRRIARELKQQRAELEERKAELAAAGGTRHVELEQELSAARAELAQVEEEHARRIQELQSTATADNSEQLTRLQQERDRFAQRLAASEATLAEQNEAGASDQQKSSDLQRRFEMAVDEVRELKRTNAELESKLKARGMPTSSAPGGGLNWEAQKQKLLASLEADDDEDEEAREVRTTIEGTIRITDQIVAQKDEEITELKRSLDTRDPQSASPSAAITELLDHDETIRQEREKLTAMQAEWREKIGEAEIDISVQRAKLARERAELDEKLASSNRSKRATPMPAIRPARPASRHAAAGWPGWV